ncbi:RING finger protein 212B isoform X1 [Zonotrichia leucophrys gambelii]|uniref:RING finger protein 212B isoform X1 n=1 Tax=Zonotrichia leucophrys gambelii TaxID=257770 RepID=UPI00314047C3
MAPASPSPTAATSCARAVGAQVPAQSVALPAATCPYLIRCAQRRRFSSRTQWPSPSSTLPTSRRCGGSRRHRHNFWWTCTGTELGGCRQSWTRPERSWGRGGGSWSHFAGRMRSCAACSSPQAGTGEATAAPPVPPPHIQGFSQTFCLLSSHPPAPPAAQQSSGQPLGPTGAPPVPQHPRMAGWRSLQKFRDLQCRAPVGWDKRGTGLCSAAGEGRVLPVGSQPTAIKDRDL